jgi:divalent metal cation (Fe/Co/Zn/Cd) transporter
MVEGESGRNIRRVLHSHGQRLQLLTICWNLGEAAVALAMAYSAHSPALAGFGFDSLIELVSSGAVWWRLRFQGREDENRRKEHRALKIVGWCFLALAVYLVIESSSKLWQKKRPEITYLGIALTTVVLLAMPILSRAKRRVSDRLSSAAMLADAKQGRFAAVLAAVTLGGLLLNAQLDWWWADPLAALLMVPIFIKEAWEALRSRSPDEYRSDQSI